MDHHITSDALLVIGCFRGHQLRSLVGGLVPDAQGARKHAKLVQRQMGHGPPRTIPVPANFKLCGPFGNVIMVARRVQSIHGGVFGDGSCCAVLSAGHYGGGQRRQFQ